MTSTTADSPGSTARYAADLQGNYDLIVAAFVGLLLISNVGATKAIAFSHPDRLAGHDRHRRRRLPLPAHLRAG